MTRIDVWWQSVRYDVARARQSEERLTERLSTLVAASPVSRREMRRTWEYSCEMWYSALRALLEVCR